MDCLFCSIANGEIPADIVYQDSEMIAFNDIKPQAPVHVLIIPKKHIRTINDIESIDTQLMGNMLLAAKQIAHDSGVAENGYRLVFNTNQHGGQEVFHIHLHLLAGRSMTWPPG